MTTERTVLNMAANTFNNTTLTVESATAFITSLSVIDRVAKFDDQGLAYYATQQLRSRIESLSLDELYEAAMGLYEEFDKRFPA